MKYVICNINKLKYICVGLWHKRRLMKFYKQIEKKYVSQSLINNMYSDKYDVVLVDNIKNIMEENNHKKIDMLKLDIEGAEIEVLNKMLSDKIYPRYLLIEFDLLLKNKDENGDTQKIINKLINIGYKILANDNLNITMEFIN